MAKIKTKSQVVFERNLVDLDSGELVSTERVIRREVMQESFIKTYVSDICKLAMCTPAEVSLILCGLQFIDYNTNEFILNKARRNILSTQIGISINTLNCSITKLYKKNILVKHENGNIYLNPRLFFFGTDVERAEILKLTIMYEIKD